MIRDWFMFKITVQDRGIWVENKRASNKVKVFIFMTVLWYILLSSIISLRKRMATSRSTYYGNLNEFNSANKEKIGVAILRG